MSSISRTESAGPSGSQGAMKSTVAMAEPGIKAQLAKNGLDEQKNNTDTPSNGERETSPIRPTPRPSNIARPGRSRKNSQEFSPTRTANSNGTYTTVPSAAAVQRALSANRPHALQPSVDGVLEGGRSDKVARSGTSSPSRPTSPRVRSPPPPQHTKRPITAVATPAGQDPVQPSTSVKRPASIAAPERPAPTETADHSKDPATTVSGLRSPGRGVSAPSSVLETVAEGDAGTTPPADPVVDSATAKATTRQQESKTKPGASDSDTKAVQDKDSKAETDNKPKQELRSAALPKPNLAKRSLTSLTGAKNKAAVEPLRTMTVETETVSPYPPIIGGERGLSGRDGSGTVRTKPSSETIRPKKDKKKTARKPPSIHAGTGTSKAEIFEAKVANAIDQTNSSDSDETFVYESNPPEPHASRHHSRTPSATSLASQVDGARNKNPRNGSHGVSGKRSMKFSSAHHHHLDGDLDTPDNARGSIRNGSSTPRHHQVSRYNRSGHASLFDNDSPFTQANRASSPRGSGSNTAKLPKPNSPRVSTARVAGSPRKSNAHPFAGDEEVADDERAPLLGSVRVNRSGRSRRLYAGSLRDSDYDYDSEPPRSRFSRYGACLLITLLLLVICAGTGLFMMTLNQPLLDVSIMHIQGVLASEQELMLDLHIEATNPNLFAITVSQLDVNLFAESAYVGTTSEWEEQRVSVRTRPRLSPHHGAISVPDPIFYADDGIDEGTDPIHDPELGTQKMLLGRILKFDSPLVFEPSPIKRVPSSSVGEIRLAKPGNHTEAGGSLRWERVLQHPFDLIVRGFISYHLPIASWDRTAKIGGCIKVTPEDDSDDHDDDRTSCQCTSPRGCSTIT